MISSTDDRPKNIFIDHERYQNKIRISCTTDWIRNPVTTRWEKYERKRNIVAVYYGSGF